ncbi:hypothetical protein LCGC14_2019370 [marine sediment metagenome]|uniref:7-cyano-7-deazaguanine synthase n=1 Tax=marine sediment metagenome TaxID=412755 RepID=A0A0F9HV29_9ZZZZ
MKSRKGIKSKKEKCVLILSGGMDSTTLLYYLLDKGYDVHSISFDYGQKHKKELMYAAKTCNCLDVPHKIVKVPDVLGGSALTSDDIDVPEGHYEADNMKITVVPNRNAIFIMLAAGYAESIKAGKVFYGVHAGDHAVYWDCRPEFYEKVNDLLKLNDIFPVKLEASFISMTKDDIVLAGQVLNVDYNLTWSCYKGGEKACGKCGTCVERIEAFKKVGIKDPIEYEVR